MIVSGAHTFSIALQSFTFLKLQAVALPIYYTLSTGTAHMILYLREMLFV